MKKIIAISMLTVSLAATSAFGQGYFQFATGKSQAWDGFTTAGVSVTSTKVAVAFLWAPASTATPMPIASTLTTGNNQTGASYDTASAWSAILSGSDAWTVASAVGPVPIGEVRGISAANGGISYNGGVSFGVTGTLPGTSYSLFMVGYDSQYASLAAAAAAGSAVGWSSVFQYAAVDSIGTAASMASQGANFGVFVPVAVPEPTTIALAGLGGLALLALRRKK